MTVGKLGEAFSSAVSRARITVADVDAFRAAISDDVVTDDELRVLRSLAEAHRDKFEPAATARLSELLANPSAPPAPSPAPAAATTVSWDDFTVSSTREGLGGAQRDEGLATFDALAGAVTSGTLSEADRLLLASAAARVGVMGEAQALRAVELLAKLPAADAAKFSALVDQAQSPLERAFVFKALAAGYPVAELEPFAAQIRGWDRAKLLSTLNLADPIVEDGAQTGLKQQFRASCVPTTGQALRGEVDPVYALAVRTGNTDVHRADEADPYALNKPLADEQAKVLTDAGGAPSPRSSWYGSGTPWARLDEVYNRVAAQTGFVYASVQFDEHPELTLDAALDELAGQLGRGIPTPLLVGVAGAPKCHAMIALEAQGTGGDQRFLIHDPWEGTTLWVTRAELVAGNAPMGEFHVIGGFHRATPAPPAP